MANASGRVKVEYLKAKGENQYIKVELYYALGGINYFTYKNEPRGYYLSVSPVERRPCYGGMMESYTAFSGVKTLVEPCARKGKGAEARALAQYDEQKAKLLAGFADRLEEVA